MSGLKLKRLAEKLKGTTVSVRRAKILDIAGMTNLLGEFFSEEKDFSPNIRLQRQGLGQLIESLDTTLLVAVENDVVVGMCTLQPLVSTAEGGVVGVVEDLVVTRAKRALGVGSMLLSTVEDIAKQKGMKRLQLLSDVGNKKVDKFYQDRGWEHTHLMTMRKKFE